MHLIKQFSKPGVDYYIMPHTCYGNCEGMVYIKSCSEHYAYNLATDELYRTHLPNATHYHYQGHLYSTRHIWHVNYPVTVLFIDGEEVACLKGIPAHDRTLFHDGNQWVMYIRGFPLNTNSVAVQTSKDFIRWKDPKPVKINGIFDGEVVYSFGVFRIGEHQYAIANVLTAGDPFHSPDYHEHEYRIYPKSLKYTENEWRLYPLNIEGIAKGYEQCFINVCVKDDIAYLTTQESKRKHASYCNIHEMEAKPVTSRIFEMSVTELLTLPH